MQVIDAQLHEIGPRLSWPGADEKIRYGVLTETTLGWMDALGVQKALIHPMDANWGIGAISEHKDRFAGVYKVSNPEGPDVWRQVEEARKLPQIVGLRLVFGKVQPDPTGEIGIGKFRSGAFDEFFRACEAQKIPLFCAAFDYSPCVGEIALRHPGLAVIVDHIGIAQPPLNPLPEPPWKALPELLSLSTLPNVLVKLCGMPVFSSQLYPFSDVRPQLRAMVAAFGPERIMWGSDIGRFAGRIGWQNNFPKAHADYPGRHSYAESLYFIKDSPELSRSEKEMILAGTVTKLLDHEL